MSLRGKASEVLAEGVAQRGHFTPSGAPLRMYNYWLNNSVSNRALNIRTGVKRVI